MIQGKLLFSLQILASGRKAKKGVEGLKNTLRTKMNLPQIHQLVLRRETIFSIFSQYLRIEHLPRTTRCVRSWEYAGDER